MTDERYWEIERSQTVRLTPEELAEGWHFCPDWDSMLVGPGMAELGACLCRLPGE